MSPARMALFLRDGRGDTPAILCEPPLQEWTLLQQRRLNTLIGGRRHTLERAVSAILPSLRRPVHRPRSEPWLQHRPDGGTLILDAVESLNRQTQQDLHRWLDGALSAGTQVISLTTTRLFDQVQAGAFESALYYRLNTVHIQVSHRRNG
jgi:hypothetical protein